MELPNGQHRQYNRIDCGMFVIMAMATQHWLQRSTAPIERTVKRQKGDGKRACVLDETTVVLMFPLENYTTSKQKEKREQSFSFPSTKKKFPDRLRFRKNRLRNEPMANSNPYQPSPR
jgi:hypothetical protein